MHKHWPLNPFHPCHNHHLWPMASSPSSKARLHWHQHNTKIENLYENCMKKKKSFTHQWIAWSIWPGVLLFRLLSWSVGEQLTPSGVSICPSGCWFWFRFLLSLHVHCWPDLVRWHKSPRNAANDRASPLLEPTVSKVSNCDLLFLTKGIWFNKG